MPTPKSQPKPAPPREPTTEQKRTDADAKDMAGRVLKKRDEKEKVRENIERRDD